MSYFSQNTGNTHKLLFSNSNNSYKQKQVKTMDAR